MTVLGESRQSGAAARTGTGPYRVLVVEDDPDTCSGVRVRLEHDGYEVFSVGDGNNAVSLVQKLAPHAVLLDLGLPGISGLDVLKRLSALRPDMPVIVVSAWEAQQFEDACLTAGACFFLQKPVPGDQLAAAVRSVVGDDV